MKRTRLIPTLIAVVSTATALAACGSSSSSSSSASASGASSGSASASGTGGSVKVGFSTITLTDPFFVRLNGGASAVAKATGVDLSLLNPNGDPQAQNNEIQDLTTQKVGAIIVDPIDPVGVLPSLRAAKAAGIPIVAVDEVLSKVGFISASAGDDNYNVGKKLGTDLANKARSMGGRQDVAIVQTTNSPIENTRVQGFLDGIKSNPNVHLYNRVNANYSANTAYQGADSQLSGDSNIRWFYVTGGIYGIGALSAIRAHHDLSKVHIIGWDLTKELVPEMKSGMYMEAAIQNANGEGKLAIQLAKDLAQGKKVTRFNTVPVQYATPQNYTQFLSQANAG